MMDGFNLIAPIERVIEVLNNKFPGFVKYATTHTQYATSKVKKYNVNEIRQYLIDNGLVSA